MEWIDDAIVLSTRRHGETGSVVVLMTRGHGRHAGRARGQKLRAALQPGTRVTAQWRGRLAEQLGSYVLEPAKSAAAGVIDDPGRLAALASACALVEAAVPERAAYPQIYEGLVALLDALESDFWAAGYVQWEIGLLRALGFGLDLERCAATGGTEDLAFVSPRTGRAVSRGAGEPYRDLMLPLPGFLVGRGEAAAPEILEGLALTGHFLERSLFAQSNARVPAARERVVDRFRRLANRASAAAEP